MTKAPFSISPFRFLALKYRQLLVLLAIPLVLSIQPLSAQIVNDVSFSCSTTPKQNINGVPVASLVEVLVKSEAPKRMTMKFNVVITGDKGHSFTTGGGKPIMPQDSYKLPYTPFGTAGPQEEFPKTCQIVDLQVCPYYPAKPAKPTPAGVRAYYDAFHQGEPAEGCRNPVNLPPVMLAVPNNAGCTGAVYGHSDGTKWWTQYGYFVRPYVIHGAKTTDDAIAQATAAASADGFQVYSNENNHPFGVQCGSPHGAVAGLRKTSESTGRWAPLPFGVWDSAVFITSSSKDDAVRQAMKECAPADPTDIHDMHVKGGVTSCELLESW